MSTEPSSANPMISYPKWTAWDVVRWWVVPQRMGGGKRHLWQYKDSWIVYNKSRIQEAARTAKIPVLLLAGIAWNEAGGMPDVMDSIAHPARSFDWCGPDWVDRKLTVLKRPEVISVGSVSIQLRVAAHTLRLDINKMNFMDRNRFKTALERDTFNLNVVAMHLRNLILRDYPGADTTNLTDEQIMVVGSRYNRGTARKKEDILSSAQAPLGDPRRDYSSNGRTLLRHRDRVRILFEQRAFPGR